MRVLDLFGGYGTMSKAFADRGHEVLIVDNNPECPALVLDVFEVEPDDFVAEYGPFDVVVASPPCQAFSVARIGRNWFRDANGEVGLPKTPQAELAIKLVQRGLEYIAAADPSSWWLENPVGALRKMPFMSSFQHGPVDYCQYRLGTKKPTDLWGKWENWTPRPRCTSRPKDGIIEVEGVPYVVNKDGGPCHIHAPRKSQTGTQRPGDKYVKNPFPYALCEDLCIAAEGTINERVLSDG